MESRTILVIDDEEIARELISSLIRKKGFAAVCAGTGREGIDIFNTIIPDAVFLDIMLPDIHGGEVFKEIKKVWADVPIYFISGSDYELTTLYDLNIKSEGFISKPISCVININEILDDVREKASKIKKPAFGRNAEKPL
ncbi:response regulator transcription factor [Elusimicrobiota bacterium]